MFVGVVVENFHRCRIEQEREERAVRAIKNARKNEEKRKSMQYKDTMDNWILCTEFVLICQYRVAREALLAGIQTFQTADTQICYI